MLLINTWIHWNYFWSGDASRLGSSGKSSILHYPLVVYSLRFPVLIGQLWLTLSFFMIICPILICRLLVYNNSLSFKPVTHEQVFFDKFWLGKFYLLVCKEEFVNFFLDKCTCSKASMIAFEQVHLARKKLSHCRICSSVRVDKENLSKKIRKLRAHSGLVVVMFRISYCSKRQKLWKLPSSSSLSSCTKLLAKPWDWLRLCVA